MVTRRPLEMRLVHEHASQDYKPWAEFDQERGKKYFDFNQVKKRIEEFTDQKAGRNKGIIADPILLTIHSPNCPDLTLVDLPGITRIPMSGSDQKQDIEKVTKDMAMQYLFYLVMSKMIEPLFYASSPPTPIFPPAMVSRWPDKSIPRVNEPLESSLKLISWTGEPTLKI